MKNLLASAILIAIILALLFAPIPNLGEAGKGDYRAYWSAAYLLAKSENFSDSELLFSTEKQLAGWDGDFAVSTWNPPWLLTILLPYTLVSFTRASWLWLSTNIIIIFISTIMAWLASTSLYEVKKYAWLAPFIGLSFSPAMTALYMGQVNTVVLLGLSAYLILEKYQYLTGAGAALALTTVKSHLVYIAIPILTLKALWSRHWRFIIGLGGALLILTTTAFLLRPSFLIEYASHTSDGGLLDWVTPTLGGFLSDTFGWHWSKLMGLLILPVSILWWWSVRDTIQTPELVQITILISLITAPFGWGYDAIILLIPIIQIVVWIFEKRYHPVITAILMCALFITNALIFYQRVNMDSEVEIFWVPIIIALIYFLARSQKSDLDMVLAL